MWISASESWERKHRERRENNCLDEADEKFESHERHGGDVGDQRTHNDEKYFAGENIAEQSERKRNDFW